MEKRIHNSMNNGSSKMIKLSVMLLLTAMFQGVAADEIYQPVSDDLASEIREQGASALQQMTQDLQQSRDWSKLGARELEATLKQQSISDDQGVKFAVLPECDECKDCHNCSERG